MAQTRNNTQVANQYGINLGNILGTASRLKTAELRQKRLQREEDTADAENEEFGNYLSKNKPDSAIAPVDENEDGEIDAKEKQTALRKTGMKWGAHNKITDRKEKTAEVNSRNNRRNILNKVTLAKEARAVKKEADRITREAKEDEAMTKWWITRGKSPEEAKMLNEAGTKAVESATKVYESQDKLERRKTREGLSKSGAQLGKMIEMSDQDPQGTEKMYQEKRESLLQRENDLREAGMPEKANEVKEKRASMPKTILVDGKINKDYLTNSLKDTKRIAERLDATDDTDKEGRAVAKEKRAQEKHKLTQKNALAKEKRAQEKHEIGKKPTHSQAKKAEADTIKNLTDLYKDPIFGEVPEEARETLTLAGEYSFKNPTWSTKQAQEQAEKDTGYSKGKGQKKEKSTGDRKEGSLYRENGKVYKIRNGKPVEQRKKK